MPELPLAPSLPDGPPGPLPEAPSAKAPQEDAGLFGGFLAATLTQGAGLSLPGAEAQQDRATADEAPSEDATSGETLPPAAIWFPLLPLAPQAPIAGASLAADASAALPDDSPMAGAGGLAAVASFAVDGATGESPESRLLESDPVPSLPTAAHAGASGTPAPEPARAPRVAVAVHVETPVGRPGWDRALGERIGWLVGKEVQQAHIHLNPGQLGPIEIQLHARHEQLSVTLGAAHAATQDALQASLGRLREMLADTRFAQVDIQLAGHGFGQADADPGRNDGARPDAAPGWADEPADEVAPPPVARIRGLLDDYA